MKLQDAIINHTRSIVNGDINKPEKSSGKVNMKNLIQRYKREKAKERAETYIFVGLACALIVISGLIISL
tara:strand:- start:187 stop:396 length:210 start_codon:yes stop_codon:yes gene_type:complete